MQSKTPPERGLSELLCLQSIPQAQTNPTAREERWFDCWRFCGRKVIEKSIER